MRSLRIEGDEMPVLGLGTWQLEGSDCRESVSAALDMGYRHIDTASMYGNEEEVGAAIASSGIPRQDLWITSKIWREHLHHDDALGSIDKSLEKLGCDYLDLMLIHWPNEEVPLRETMLALKEVCMEGRVRHIGVSNFTLSQVKESQELAPVICNQVECHLFLQQHDMHKLLRDLDMIMIAYSPLARGHVEDDAKVANIAAKHGATPEQIALAWLLHREGVASIPKATSERHLRENLDALNIQLDHGDLETISKLDRGERLINPEFAPAWGT